MSSHNNLTQKWVMPADAVSGLSYLMRLTNSKPEGTDDYRKDLEDLLATWAAPLLLWRRKCSGTRIWLMALDEVMERFQQECLEFRRSILDQEAFNKAIARLLVCSFHIAFKVSGCFSNFWLSSLPSVFLSVLTECSVQL